MARAHETIQDAVQQLLRMNELDGYRVRRVHRAARGASEARRAARVPCLSPFGPSVPAHVAGANRWVITLEPPAASAFHAYLCEPCAEMVLREEWRTSAGRRGE